MNSPKAMKSRVLQSLTRLAATIRGANSFNGVEVSENQIHETSEHTHRDRTYRVPCTVSDFYAADTANAGAEGGGSGGQADDPALANV